jgi:hypothetical protein
MTNTKLKTITKRKLDKVLSNHKTWLDSYGTKGTRADLSYTDLSNTDLSLTDLFYSNLSNSNLSHSDLYGSNLSNSDLSGANLTNSNLSYSILSYSILPYSDLSNSDLSGANLTNINLTKANISNIIGKRIITFQGNKDFAYYVDGYIKIGCEYHTLDYWIKNYERIGTEAEYSSEDIESYGNWIKSIKTEG